MDAAQVRQLLLRQVEARGLAPATLIGETVLIRDGFYVGRRFVFEGLEATWLLDSAQISLRSDEEGVLAPVDLPAFSSQRPAA